MLLAALSYAFWLSFTIVDSPNISPTIWPLVWLAFAALIVFDPFPFLYRSSRYWLIKNVAKLFVSGTRPVEFSDFWMGDQFCSLTFTLSNLYFFVCVYADDFGQDWAKCRVTSLSWPVYFVLGSLPLFIRLVQSIKRYADSKLITHLINGGKYASGIVSALFFYLWRRHQDGRGTIFAFWVLTNVCYSAYACAWDFLMDWSVLRLHGKYPLLRPELVYTNHLPMYYFAIITNFIIRFLWVIYIPKPGPNMMVRTFIVAVLEMLRRWQWNFYRLENEHLGNMDQYRVTREVPLPYAFNDRSREDDADDEDDRIKVRR
ncbi:EXS-domain-containing protein [Agrocybe pediades]|nr:EXS-domain-containing protein [Agrocybe pediades]